jgi:hypothetical protein
VKKVLIVTNAALLSIILFMSCNKTDLTTSPVLPSPCNPCTNHTGTPFVGISGNLAKSMFTDYKNQNQPLLQLDDGTEDANRIWFSLETLKNFIWKIEEEACKHACIRPMNLGVRIYYAKYPDNMNNPELNTLPANYAKHHTLFMVPTYQDISNNETQWDFDPWHWGSNACEPTPLVDLFKNASSVVSPFGANKSLILTLGETNYYKSANGTISEWAMNHGNMNPPPPPPGSVDGSGFNN